MVRNEIPNSSYQYYKQFSKDLKPMSPEEEAFICKRIAAGDEAARDTLIMGYLYLAEKLALDEATKSGRFNMSDDLIQAAIYGLSKAAASFNPDNNTRFYAYAMSAINNSIQDECISYDGIHRNRNFHHNVYIKVENFYNQYTTEHEGANPSQQEICKALNITPEQCRLAMDTYVLTHATCSLDEQLPRSGSDDNPMYIADRTADPDSTSFADELATKDIIRDALSCLSDRDREIITLRFGLNGGKEMSRDELANLFGTTPNNITKRVTASLSKMQKHLTRDERDER